MVWRRNETSEVWPGLTPICWRPVSRPPSPWWWSLSLCWLSPRERLHLVESRGRHLSCPPLGVANFICQSNRNFLDRHVGVSTQDPQIKLKNLIFFLLFCLLFIDFYNFITKRWRRRNILSLILDGLDSTVQWARFDLRATSWLSLLYTGYLWLKQAQTCHGYYHSTQNVS